MLQALALRHLRAIVEAGPRGGLKALAPSGGVDAASGARAAAAAGRSLSSSPSVQKEEKAGAARSGEKRSAGLQKLTALRSLLRAEEEQKQLDDFVTETRGLQVTTTAAAGAESYSVNAPTPKQQRRDHLRKPDWLKHKKLPRGDRFVALRTKLRELNLATVCEEAKCPNLGECWGGDADSNTPATATIMLLGDTCTRACRFCAVKTSRTPPPPDREEPRKVAAAISEWGIGYVVFTTVDRDDLPDQGAAHIAETVGTLKALSKGQVKVEALVGDFNGNLDDVEKVSKRSSKRLPPSLPLPERSMERTVEGGMQ